MITVISTTILVRLCHMLYAQSVRKDFYGLSLKLELKQKEDTGKVSITISRLKEGFTGVMSCGKEFVKVDNEFLELKYSKNPN